jgi:ABC-type sugar transport system ATPase subunit
MSDNSDKAAPTLPGPAPLGAGPGDALLAMRGICKDFTGGRVLHEVDFDVARGEVHALVGENGAGKSTLMKVLAGLYPDYHGTVFLDGDEVEMRDPRTALSHGVAVIYQEFALVPDLTVAENIALGREQRASAPGLISHAGLRRRSQAEAEDLDIDLPMDARAGDLPVGQQQMCEIVKAVARDASVLVMDEPTARLNDDERARLFELVSRLSSRGVGIVYISHYLEEVFAIASRVTVLRDGRRVACRKLSELNLTQLAQLMVGDKFHEIENKSESHARHDEPPALEIEGLEVEGALKPVNLTVARGEVVALAGLQGAGRAQFARALVGAVPRASGRIVTERFSGLPKGPYNAAAAGILMLPADRKSEGIIAFRPVGENIALSALRGRLSKAGLVRGRASKRLAKQMVEEFSVRPAAPEIEMRSLSGGNQQKVLFARAAAAEVPVLILDQPTAGVDVGAKVELYGHIDRLTEEGVAVILLSDDLAEMLRLADSIVFVRNGEASEPQPATDYERATLLEAITGGRLPTKKNGAAPKSAGVAAGS